MNDYAFSSIAAGQSTPFRSCPSKGSATWTRKNWISGPVKKAVMMVPTPTIAESSLFANRQKRVPMPTQTKSVMMRAQRKAMRF